MSTIKALPQETVSQLRSSFIIQSLPACLLELIQNALDAQARRIEIAFGLEAWQCRVTDDGTGIERNSLKSLGKRYHTSKCHRLQDLGNIRSYGYRGEALASIADISLLEVLTRHMSSPETWSSILKGGEQVYCGPAKHRDLASSGTTVHVRDLFYKWPVRRKQAETSSSYRLSTINQIRKGVEALAIVNPHASFTVLDLDRQSDVQFNGLLLSIPRTKSILATFGAIYGRGYIGKVELVDQADGDYRFLGFLSLTSAYSKHLQIVYVNNRPIAPCAIHHRINQLFSYSSFSRRSENDQRLSDNEVSPNKALTRTDSPRKHLDRHPVFCLNLYMPPDRVDIGLEPTKRLVSFHSEERIIQLVDSITRAFLRKNGFTETSETSSSESLEAACDPVNLPAVHLTPSPMKRAKRQSASHQQSKANSTSNLIRWQDPLSELVYVIEEGSGRSWLPDDPQLLLENREADGSLASPPPYQLAIDRSKLRRSGVDVHQPHTAADSIQKAEAPAWLAGVIKGWSNPVFPPAHRIIPSAETIQKKGKELSTQSPSLPSAAQQISKESLRNLVFIEQVDRKFLLCSLVDGEQKSLVLVDQHAADERTRVERYLKTYCEQVTKGEVDCVSFQEARPVLLTPSDVQHVYTDRDTISQWGIKILPPLSLVNNEVCQVFVESVPALLADRLTTDTRLLQQVLKRFVVQLIESDMAKVRPGNTWTSVLRQCPSLLVDLVNSKACRGAIMFNDVLDSCQSEMLLNRLAETDYPFICAHGRPTMVPIVRMGEKLNNLSQRKMTWKHLLSNRAASLSH